MAADMDATTEVAAMPAEGTMAVTDVIAVTAEARSSQELLSVVYSAGAAATAIPAHTINAIASITGPIMRRVAITGTIIMADIPVGTTAIPMAAITPVIATATPITEPATPSTSVDNGTGARQRLAAPCATTGAVKDMWSPAAAI